MQNRQFETTAVIEAGALAALILLIMLTTAYVPFLSFLNILLPIPVALLYLRHNLKVSISVVIVSGTLVSMFYDPFSTLGTCISYGLTGLTLGYCIKQEIKAFKTICFLALASGISLILNMSILIFFTTPGGLAGFIKYFNNTFNSTMKEMITQTKDLYSKFGLSEQQNQLINQQLQAVNITTFKGMLLEGLVVVSFCSAIINYFVARTILKKLRVKLVEVTPFSELYISEKVGFFIAILAIISMLLQSSKIDLGKYIITSVIAIISMVFIIEGLAVASYYLKNRFKLRKSMIILIILVTLIPFQSAYQIIGLIDIVIDIRKVNPKRLLNK